MMIISDSYFLYLLMISNALLLAIACFTLVRFERRCKRIEEFWDSPTGTALADSGDDDIRAQTLATQRLELKLGELQRTVKAMHTKPAPQQAAVEFNLPIENAVRMARHGASIDDLTRNCGLNIGEARLVQKLHGQADIQASA